MAGTGLPAGWWEYVSENNVTHAVPPAGPCSTCGVAHDRAGYQVETLYELQRAAERDAVADYGQQMIDAGGWREICRAVLDSAPFDVLPAARAEYLRCNGLDY